MIFLFILKIFSSVVLSDREINLASAHPTFIEYLIDHGHSDINSNIPLMNGIAQNLIHKRILSSLN
jgi:hypothetical protein